MWLLGVTFGMQGSVFLVAHRDLLGLFAINLRGKEYGRFGTVSKPLPIPQIHRVCWMSTMPHTKHMTGHEISWYVEHEDLEVNQTNVRRKGVIVSHELEQNSDTSRTVFLRGDSD